MSIQSDLSGLSFFNTKNELIGQLCGSADDESILEYVKKLRKLSAKIKIITATDNFSAIPSYLYIESGMKLYFEAKSICFDDEKFLYSTEAVSDYLLTTTIERDLYNIIEHNFSQIEITHPLVENLRIADQSGDSEIMIVSRFNKRAAITLIVDGELKISEFVQLAASSDLTYFIQKIILDNNLAHCKIVER